MMRPVILSSPEKLAFLLVIFDERRLGDDFIARLQRRRRLRHALGLALSRRQSRQRIGRPGGALATLGPPGCGGCNGDGRRGILRNDRGAGRRRQRLRLDAAGRGYGLPRQRPVRRRQQAAARQLRHFLLVVGGRLRLIAARDRAGRTRRGIGKNIADLRARGRRKRDGAGGDQGRKTSQGNGSKHLARLQQANRARDIVSFIRRSQGPPVNTANTAGKGRFPALPGHWSARATNEIVVAS